MKEYVELIERLLTENKTTGDNHSEAMLHYTRMNLKRLNRWAAKGELLPETENALKSINEPQQWIVLTEAWCGDAAHSIAFIQKMADLNDNISITYKLRDENLELMDNYLTNGGRSIPKLIVRDEKGNDVFDWGPRPAHIQHEYLAMRTNEMPYDEISVALQKMYNKDKGASIQREITALLMTKPAAH